MIQFNAQLINSKKQILSLSGRLGPFIFRTLQNGLITAYYKPKSSSDKQLSRPHRENIETISRQLREITDQLGLSVKSISAQNPTTND